MAVLDTATLKNSAELTRIIQDPELRRKTHWAYDVYFEPFSETTDSRYVIAQRESRKNKLAPLTRFGDSSTPMHEPRTATTQQLELINISINTTLGAEELLEKKFIVDNLSVTNQDNRRTQDQFIGNTVSDHRTFIDGRLNKLCFDLLISGKHTYSDDTIAIDIDRATTAAYKQTNTGNDRWDITTGTGKDKVNTSNILDQVRTNSNLMQSKGYTLRNIVLGENASKSFLNHTGVHTNLDNNNFTVGRVDARVNIGSFETALTPLGNYAGVNWWMHNAKYVDSADAEQLYLPTNGALYLPTPTRDNFINYKGITGDFIESPRAYGYATYTEFNRDPVSVVIVSHFRGLPNYWDNGSVIYQQVQDA